MGGKRRQSQHWRDFLEVRGALPMLTDKNPYAWTWTGVEALFEAMSRFDVPDNSFKYFGEDVQEGHHFAMQYMSQYNHFLYGWKPVYEPENIRVNWDSSTTWLFKDCGDGRGRATLKQFLEVYGDLVDFVWGAWGEIFFPFMIQAFVKEEPSKKGKKPRPISPMDACQRVVAAMLLQGWNDRWVENFDQSPVKVGMSKDHAGFWYQLSKLLSYKWKESSDFGEFEARRMWQCIWAQFLHRWQTLDPAHKTLENFNRLWFFAVSDFVHWIDIAGFVFFKSGGKITGNIDTASGNSWDHVYLDAFAYWWFVFKDRKFDGRQLWALNALRLETVEHEFHSQVRIWNDHISRMRREAEVFVYGDDNFRGLTEPMSQLWGMVRHLEDGTEVIGPRQQFWTMIGYVVKEVKCTERIEGHTWLGSEARWAVTRDGRKVLIPYPNWQKLIVAMSYKYEQARLAGGYLAGLEVLEGYRKDLYWNSFWYSLVTQFAYEVRELEFEQTGRLFELTSDKQFEDTYLKHESASVWFLVPSSCSS